MSLMEQSRRNLTALAAVVQVAEKGSFTAASKTLGLSASAVSKSIARLEQRLGVKLFRRTTRNVSMTPEGERYVQGARPLLLGIDALEAEVADSQMTPRGLLRVSVPEAFGRSVIAPNVGSFLARYPEVRIELVLEDRDVEPAAENVDIAIRSGPLPNSANLRARRIYSDPMVTCATPCYLHDHGTPHSPQDLTRYNCLNFRNTRTGRPVPWTFGNSDRMHVAGTLTSNEIEAVCKFALAGDGIAQLPGYLVKKDLEEGLLIEVLLQHRAASVPYSALFLDRQSLSPRIRAFIDFLVELNGSGE